MFLPDKDSKNSQPQISVLPPLFHQQTPGSQSQKSVSSNRCKTIPQIRIYPIAIQIGIVWILVC
jgi:hypothetical protein